MNARKPHHIWVEEAKAYYQSQEWKSKKQRLIDLYGKRCMAPGCEATIVDMHHLTYANWMHEPLEDLILYCREHHEEAHAKPIPDLRTLEQKINDFLSH